MKLSYFIKVIIIITTLLTIVDFALVHLTHPLFKEECVVGQFIVPSPYGAVIAGDQEICGYGLRFSTVVGPSKLGVRLD